MLACDSCVYKSCIRLDDRLFESSRPSFTIGLAVADTLLVLILCEDGVGAARQQHHADEERYDCLDCHLVALLGELTLSWIDGLQSLGGGTGGGARWGDL